MHVPHKESLSFLRLDTALSISWILSQFSALQFSSRTGIRRISSFALFYGNVITFI